MKHLFYIKVPFKRAKKNGYPIYIKGEDKVIYASDINLKKVEQQYVLTSGEYKSYYDISGRNRDNGSYLYGKIPLIYSNLFYWIGGFTFSLAVSIISNIALTRNPIHLIICSGIVLIWLAMLQYWQKNELEKWIDKTNTIKKNYGKKTQRLQKNAFIIRIIIRRSREYNS